MKIEQLFSFKTKQKFNCFAVSKLSSGALPEVIVGHYDGTIRTYKIPTGDSSEAECTSSHETKSGAIQRILVADLTRLSYTDLIAADSKGFLTILSNQQVLSRSSVFQHSINNLHFLKHPAGGSSVVLSSVDGEVCCVSGHSEVWRLRLEDIKLIKQQIGFRPRVTCLLSTSLNTPHHTSPTYTLIATDSHHLLFYLHHTLAFVLPTPFIITAMCAGKFVSEDDIEYRLDTPGINDNKSGMNRSNNGTNLTSYFPLQTQVALSSETGSIIIMANFHLYTDEYANVGYAVRRMVRMAGMLGLGLDCLVTAGDIDRYSVVEDGKVVQETATRWWVNCMQVFEVDGSQQLVFSCIDNSIQAHHFV